MTTTSGAVRTAACSFVAALALTACGSSDSPESSDSADPSPTASATPEFALADLVPDAETIGEGFRASSTVDADISPVLRQGLQKCPAALGLIDSVEDPIERQGYIDAEGRIIEVRIDDGAEAAPDEEVRTVATALGSCEQQTVSLGTSKVGITIAGGIDEGVGEQGLRVATTTTVDTGSVKVSQNFYVLQFRRGDVGVQIRALDAVKGGERIKLDPEVLLAVGDAIDAELEEALSSQ